MKKIVYLALCLGALASLDSCNPRAKATTVQTTKRYTEHIVNDDYNKFVDAIKFTEPGAKALRKPAAKAVRVVKASNVQRQLRNARQNWNHSAAVKPAVKPTPVQAPVVVSKPAAKPVAVVPVAAKVDNSLRHTLASDIQNKMASEDRNWKIRTTDNKEVWRTRHGKHARSAGKLARETMKVRDSHRRDFLKDNTRGDRRFVKDIVRRRGQEEVVKTLENGLRKREAVKVLNEGRRQIDKLKRGTKKLVDVKDIDRRDREIIKAKDSYRGNRERFREVFVK